VATGLEILENVEKLGNLKMVMEKSVNLKVIREKSW